MLKDHKLALMRSLLWEMEVEAGLVSLSQPQRDVYYAACLVAAEKKIIHSEQVRQHPMIRVMARPTFYRALRELVIGGHLAAATESKKGHYWVRR